VVSGMPRAAILKGYANKMFRSMTQRVFDQNYGAERGAADKVEKNEKLEVNDKNERIEKTSFHPIAREASAG